MGRHASDTGGGDFKQAPAGTHVARCIKLIDLGTQHGEYQGEPTVRNQVMAQWELPLETYAFDGEDRPFIVSKFYTNSLSEKANLRKDLEAWRSRPFTQEELVKFDLMKILGAPCMLTVVHNEKGKAKVVGVSALPKGLQCPPAVNPLSSFWLDEYDDNAFAALPEGIRDIIVKSDEYRESFAPPGSSAAPAAAKGEPVDDDIPF
jgi:hypothetical protein